MNSLIGIISLGIATVFVNCQKYEPLGLTIQDGRFIFPDLVFSKIQANEFDYNYDSTKKIYYFCSEDSENLYFVESNEDNIIPTCKSPTKPMLVEVNNIKTVDENFPENHIKWLVNGYKIHFKRINELQIENENFVEDNEKINVEVIPGLSLFYDNQLKITIAGQYELISSPIYKKETTVLSQYENAESVDLTQFDIFFKSRTGIIVVDNYQRLTLTPFVPPSHYVIPLWTDLARTKVNLKPMWLNSSRHEIILNNFLEIVAKKLGIIYITSGITIENTKKTNGFIIPEFVWRVVEYHENNISYGIILVIRNSLSYMDKKICTEDICRKNKWAIRCQGETISINEVYCCNMKKNNIRNLKADYFHFDEAHDFDLGQWGFQNEHIC